MVLPTAGRDPGSRVPAPGSLRLVQALVNTLNAELGVLRPVRVRPVQMVFHAGLRRPVEDVRRPGPSAGVRQEITPA